MDSGAAVRELTARVAALAADLGTVAEDLLDTVDHISEALSAGRAEHQAGAQLFAGALDGLDVAAPHAIVLVVAGVDWAERAAAVLGGITVPAAGRAAMVVPAANPRVWQSALRVASRLAKQSGVTMLAADPVIGLNALQREYSAAMRVLPLAGRGLTRMRDLLLPRLLTEADAPARRH